MKPNRKVNSYDEWSRLREVIVGVADHYNRYHMDVTFKLFYFENVAPILARARFPGPFLPIPGGILEELQEDIEGLVNALQDFGVVVRRPNRLTGPTPVQTPFWSSYVAPALNVRDQTMILGDAIVETATHVRARYFENDYLKPILDAYFEAGSRWTAMPRPSLGRGSVDAAGLEASRSGLADYLADDDATGLDGLGYEMIFDGAQCIRIGRDVVVNVATENHVRGLSWLEREHGSRFRFHRTDRLADNHIDSVLMPIRPV